MTGFNLNKVLFSLFLLILTACGQPKTGWATFPVSLSADSSFESESKQADLLSAIHFWENHAGKKLFTIEGIGHGANERAATPINLIFFVNPWTLDASIVGRTTVHADNDQFKSATIMLNGSVHFCENNCASSGFATSQLLVITHELGHFLGLGHSGEKENVMYPSVVLGLKLDGMRVDVESLRSITEEN